jgi:hypothetical protein
MRHCRSAVQCSDHCEVVRCRFPFDAASNRGMPLWRVRVASHNHRGRSSSHLRLHRPRPPTAGQDAGEEILVLSRPDVDSPFVCLVLLVHGDTWTYHSAGFDSLLLERGKCVKCEVVAWLRITPLRRCAVVRHESHEEVRM